MLVHEYEYNMNTENPGMILGAFHLYMNMPKMWTKIFLSGKMSNSRNKSGSTIYLTFEVFILQKDKIDI